MPPLIRPLFHCRRGGLIKGRLLYVELYQVVLVDNFIAPAVNVS
jgi:hypothetical protein